MNIFVAKLSPITTGEDLQQLFQEYGRVTSAKVLIDRETGRSKCFGFVEMEDYEEGNNAVNALNGAELHGCMIIVKVARPREASENEERRNRPRVEIGRSNPFKHSENRGRTNNQNGNSRGNNFNKGRERHRPGFSPRQQRGNQPPKMRKPYIKEYTMMELMEDDD